MAELLRNFHLKIETTINVFHGSFVKLMHTNQRLFRKADAHKSEIWRRYEPYSKCKVLIEESEYIENSRPKQETEVFLNDGTKEKKLFYIYPTVI